MRWSSLLVLSLLISRMVLLVLSILLMCRKMSWGSSPIPLKRRGALFNEEALRLDRKWHP